MTTNRTSHSIYSIRRPVEPIRPAVECDDCRLGCNCEGGIDGVGCDHFGCWGRAASNTCPSAEPLLEHLSAYTAYRHELSVWASSAAYFGA